LDSGSHHGGYVCVPLSFDEQLLNLPNQMTEALLTSAALHGMGGLYLHDRFGYFIRNGGRERDF